MYHVCPNYRCFYEGHYKVMWLPFLNKTLGRFYLKLRRRYSPYYETLNLIRPKMVIRALGSQRDKVDIISLGRGEFIKSFNRGQIEKVNHKALQTILKFILRLGVIRKFILAIIARLDLYYPLTIIVVKNKADKISHNSKHMTR